jgi:hypothetical protein
MFRAKGVNFDRIESGGRHVKCSIAARVFGLEAPDLRNNVLKKIQLVRRVQQRPIGASCSGVVQYSSNNILFFALNETQK